MEPKIVRVIPGAKPNSKGKVIPPPQVAYKWPKNGKIPPLDVEFTPRLVPQKTTTTNQAY